MLLALIIWIGGILFFSAVQAPETAHVLGTSNPAFAEIIGRSLSILHYFGIACGVLFLLASAAEQSLINVRVAASSRVLVLLMLLVTAFSQFYISRRLHELRTAHSGFEQLAADDPARIAFNRLHRYSVDAEGAVLLLGFGAVVLTARRMA